MARGKTLRRVAAYDVVQRGISHAPEGRKVFSTLTVTENLALGAFTRQASEGGGHRGPRPRVLAVPAAQGPSAEQLAGHAVPAASSRCLQSDGPS